MLWSFPQFLKVLCATMCSSPSKSVQTLTRKELEEEVTEYRMLMKEMKAKMECPVCLNIPKEGPVPCCPRGHLVCTTCFEKIHRGHRRDCPTCREPMGEGRSLLGKVFLENIQHQCDFKGCEEMVHFKEYKQHQMKCQKRLVICPGRNIQCQEKLPFFEVVDHAKECPDITGPFRGDSINYSKMKDGKPLIHFKSALLTIDSEVYFLQGKCVKTSSLLIWS